MRRFVFALSIMAFPAMGGTFDRISPIGGLGNISFTQLAANDTGDFVAASMTKIYAGNLGAKRIEMILDAGRDSSFAISDWQSLNAGTDRVDMTFELRNTRIAINSSGQFAVASNRNLYVGNARTGGVELVYEAPRFSEFQEVVINDRGQYVATTHESIIVGSDEFAPSAYLDEAVGTFGVYYVWGAGSRFDIVAGENRLVLDDEGRFVAIASSAVYAGNVGLGASMIYEQRNADFRHVRLIEDGYLVLSEREAFVGTFDNRF